MKNDRYTRAEALRQAVLDMLQPHGKTVMLAGDIVTALGINRQSGSKMLASMWAHGEIGRTDSKRESFVTGRLNVVPCHAYFAIATKTRPASEVRRHVAKCGSDAALKKQASNPIEPPAPAADTPPWITRNTDENRPPIRNQGAAQGGIVHHYTESPLMAAF